MKSEHFAIRFLPQFEKDLKKLRKRFSTIDNDLENFINTQLVLFHKLGKDNLGVVQVPGLAKDIPKIYKARKFACRALKGTGSRSGIRVIYAYLEAQNTIEFIEIYYKGDKENHDRDRINLYLNP